MAWVRPLPRSASPGSVFLLPSQLDSAEKQDLVSEEKNTALVRLKRENCLWTRSVSRSHCFYPCKNDTEHPQRLLCPLIPAVSRFAGSKISS